MGPQVSPVLAYLQSMDARMQRLDQGGKSAPSTDADQVRRLLKEAIPEELVASIRAATGKDQS